MSTKSLTFHTLSDVNAIDAEKTAAGRFEKALQIYEEKIALLTQKDHPLDYIFVVLTDEMYSKIRVTMATDPSSGRRRIQRNFRRALKARSMRYNKPTQIIRESSTGYADEKRDMEDLATRAWNIYTGMYFKVGGLPWAPTGLAPNTCFIGVSFYHPSSENSDMRASLAQAFDENGEGLVLRGQRFAWDESMGRSPHMPKEQALSLIEQVLARYRLERKQLPKRVVIHKSSRFEKSEMEGFEKALADIPEKDYVTIGTTGNLRLLRLGEKPPLRGTTMRVGDNWLLYTTGYILNLGKYPHGHVPSPLRIVEHVGDTHKSQLLHEMLVLSKMNWNTANVDGAFPITLHFSRLVGEILKELPDDIGPNPKYAFYM